MSTPDSKIHQAVKEHYGEYARQEAPCCTPQNKLYPSELIGQVPTDIANFSAGSGDPVTPARLQPGETVLDLGSGGGLDCFLAAKQVGDKGKVIGVDMTPEMLARARANADRLGVPNVEFREGMLERLPVEAGSIDVIISNCVINLSPDKPRVFAEMFRALKPGGRISISDIASNRPVPEEKRRNQGEWCECISGALDFQTYKSQLQAAGFEQIKVEPNIELVRRHLKDGTIRVEGDLDAKQLLNGGLDELLSRDEKSLFLPSLITARKPA